MYRFFLCVPIHLDNLRHILLLPMYSYSFLLCLCWKFTQVSSTITCPLYDLSLFLVALLFLVVPHTLLHSWNAPLFRCCRIIYLSSLCYNSRASPLFGSFVLLGLPFLCLDTHLLLPHLLVVVLTRPFSYAFHPALWGVFDVAHVWFHPDVA